MVHRVRRAQPGDVSEMVALSARKRQAYAAVLPRFWRPAPDADARQAAWFQHLLGRETTLVFVAQGDPGLAGFVLGQLHPAPPVYDPGGPTCTIDDFCVRDPATWTTTGAVLLDAVRAEARRAGAVQVVLVAAVHDEAKQLLVRHSGLTPASTWFTGAVAAEGAERPDPPAAPGATLDGAAYLGHALASFASMRQRSEAALAQVDDRDLSRRLDPGSNSVATLVKHVAGNMLSRWTDFLTSDGEKPWRQRDQEFEDSAGDTRTWLTERWNAGWEVFLATLRGLAPADLVRHVTIRARALTVFDALERQKEHHAYHLGQLAFLAKHLAGPGWRSLSIPRGASEAWRAPPT